MLLLGVFVSDAVIAKTLLVILFSVVVARVASALHRKRRIAKGIAGIPGPKGWPLIGVLPTMIKQGHRFYDFHVRIDVDSFSDVVVRLVLQTTVKLTFCIWVNLHVLVQQDDMMVKYGGRIKYPGNIISDGTVCVRVV